ncbi:MAG: AAA family ATPase, partial [Firmicutes bacterium]|nr:AAA family ATPase [Bacillota bacterium]
MYRKVSGYLEQWKDSKYRKPLIIQGARQVGKTYAILEFGRTHYDNVAYFNFQTNERLSATFDEDIRPDYLIPILSHICGQTITKGRTLIFFDEIQLCERAVTSLKYFCEEAPEYHVIAAGSLLGVAVNREKYAFPVGKVDRYTMYPMDMEEFLYACGEKDLVQRIHICFDNDQPMPAALHEAAMERYRQYLFVGGMPEAVSRFIDTRDNTQVRHVLETIQMDYLDDMSKYQ